MKKGFIIGLATGLTVAGLSVVLANSQIQAILNDQIKVTLNGQVQEFKDETTNEKQYPITYKNRTYLPLRTVANLVGVDVDYDAGSNTAILNDNKVSNSETNNIMTKEEANKLGWELYKSTENNYLTEHPITEGGGDISVFDRRISATKIESNKIEYLVQTYHYFPDSQNEVELDTNDIVWSLEKLFGSENLSIDEELFSIVNKDGEWKVEKYTYNRI